MCMKRYSTYCITTDGQTAATVFIGLEGLRNAENLEPRGEYFTEILSVNVLFLFLVALFIKLTKDN